MSDEKKVSIIVPSDEKKKEKTLEERKQDEFEKALRLLDGKEEAKDEKDKTIEDMTEEDRKLKENLELMVRRVLEVRELDKKFQEKAKQQGKPVDEAEKKEAYAQAVGLQRAALESLRKEIRSATTSMTSIPKPLKFLRPFYPPLKSFYETMPAGENKAFMADVLSVLAMTMAKENTRESLLYRLQGSAEPIGSWGHEYVRNLAGEIGQEWNVRLEAKQETKSLMALIDEIIPFNFKHNAEYEAIDLLLEVNMVEKVASYITPDTHERVCRYLISCSDLLGDPDERTSILRLSYNIYFENKNYSDAIRVAVKLDDKELIQNVFTTCPDPLLNRQLAFILGQSKMVIPNCEDPELTEIAGNVHLNASFAKLAADLDVKDAKTPEDIYKTYLTEGGGKRRGRDEKQAAAQNNQPGVDNAKQNLASTFVNAFVNCGFGRDLLVTPEGAEWVFKNRDHGMLSAAASMGMILLWDVESGFSQVDKYSVSQQPQIKAGALLANGLISAGITSEMDAAFALLSDHVNSDNVSMRTSAILGLGLAYAGTAREDVLELLTPLMVQQGQPIEVVALTSLALGLVFCGTANEGLSGSIIEAFLDRSDTDLKDSAARLMCLGLGLVFLGKGESSEAACAAISAITHPISKYLELTVETCAYAASGSVLQIQKLLQVLSEHLEDDEKDPFKSIHQEVAVLGIALAAMGEPLSVEMALRSLDHVLQYGEVNIRRAVPLAYGLLSISNPRLLVMDTLSKLSHDNDERVSMNAILALGFLGAGTNNSRIASLLRNLAVYYAKEANHLFIVRIAQGLLHLGKGLLTISPFHSDGLIFNRVALGGLLAIFHSALDLKNSILAKRHYILFSLVTAVRPRCLITLDENLKSVPVSVRVGQAVDVAGQAGKPRSITGFQTHTTPVLLAAGERAELADDKFIPLTNTLEGFVIVKPNPKATMEEK